MNRIASLFRTPLFRLRATRVILGCLSAFTLSQARAQVPFTGSYTENFNGMGTSGTAAPTGWGFYGNLGGDNNTWVSSIPAADAGLGTLNATLIASTSTTVTSNTQGYNRAASGSTSDRCLGTSPTSGRGVVWQLSLSNSTSAPVNELGIRYDTRRFNAPASANDLPGFWLFYSLDNGVTWINVSSLNPTITTVPNTTGTSVMVERNLTLASAWAPGSTLLLRWIDDNATQTSPDQIVGIDNVAITAAPPAADAGVISVDGQHVTMGTAAALGASSFTLECWFLQTGTGTTTSTGTGGVTAIPLVAKGRGEADGDNRDCNYFFGINTTGNLVADFEQLDATNNGTAYSAGQNFPVVGSSVVQSGVWNHAAATYDAATAQWKLFLNGVEETLTVPGGSPATFVGVAPRHDSIQHFSIGTAMTSTGAAQGSFHGVIDEVRVWNVARSGSEIAAAKDSAITTEEPGLLARYGMNEGIGETIAGIPAAAPSGTLSGSPLWTNGFNAAGIEAPSVTLTAPLEGAGFNLPAVVNLEATAADTDGTVEKVEFFAGSNKLGEDASAPYTFVWSGMISGSYVLTARATDNDGAATTSAPVNITIANPGNVAPSVTLTAPADGAQVAGSSTTLAATADDTDGVIAKVEFYEGVNKLGEDTSAPYTYQWSGVTTGTYSVTARAFDNDGAFTSSAAAGVTFVVPVETTAISRRPAGQPGSVWKFLDNGSDQGTAWKEPAFDDSTWASGAAPLGYTDSHIVTTVFSPAAPNRYITTYFRRTFNITGAGAVQALKLNVLRDDGVVVYINGVEVARQNMPEGPIGYLTNSASITDGANETTYFTSDVTTLPPLNEGDNVIAVELHQRDGNSSDLGFDLELVTISLPGTPPTIEITAPTEGASFTAPATVAITADAADTDGSVAKVEFFNGTEKLGEDAAAPFTYDWTVVPQGDYTLTARATDNYGLTTTSDPVSINVGPPNTVFPTVTITSPADGAEFLEPGNITIAATAGDTDGTVTKVEFFQGSTKLGEDATAPYAFEWTNVPVGNYTLTARATDNLTAATTSTPVTVEVVPNLAPGITLATPLDAATGLGGGGLVNLSATVSDPENLPLNVTFYGRPKSPPPGEDFTIVTLPDTQFYSENSGGNRLQHFTSQTNWIVSSKDALNTKFVAHMGDMVQNGDSVQQEWINADGAMQIVENPTTTLLTHGIPWGGAPGNHDQQPIGSPDGASLYWNQYFGTSRWAGRPYWGGNYSTNNDNNYQLFSAGGMDFIIVNMEYRPSANQAVLDWADALLKAHPTRRAIITSHWLIGTGNPASWGGHGQAVYDNLKDNPNLFLMLCGHIHGEGQRSDVFEGRTVNTVLQDYQSRANGGDSWLRYFTFKPSENKIYAYTYQTRTNTFETDADSQFTLDYNMAATAPWSDLGTVSLAAGETNATLPWTGLVAGNEYEWYAAVSDGVTPVGSTTRSFTASGNATPSVTLTAPADGSMIVKPATVDLTATAGDLDGTIAKVEFYNGSTKVGEDDTVPYTLAWNAPSGVHTVSARAFDGEGAFADSNSVSVTVKFDLAPSVVGGPSGSEGGTVTGGMGVTAGSTATFDAVPDSGYSFVGWLVNGAPAGTDPHLEIVVTEGMTIAAQFAEITTGVQPFTTGNIVVERIGDGTTALTSAAAPVAIIEYLPAGGAPVQTLTAEFEGANLQTDSGSATSNGNIGISGGYLAIPGINLPVGTASVAGQNAKVAQIIDLTTGMVASRIMFPTGGPSGTPPSPYSGNNFRSIAPTGENTFYTGGTSSGSPNTGGVWYYDGSAFTQVSSTSGTTNLRNVAVFEGQLYVSTGSGSQGIYAVGAGTPTDTGNSLTALVTESGMSPYGFVVFDTNGDDAVDRVYIADDRTSVGGGINRWDFNGVAWAKTYSLLVNTNNGSLSGSAGAGIVGIRGLAGTFEGGIATLHATTTETTNNRLIVINDPGTAPSTYTELASAGVNQVFRGVGMVPVLEEEPQLLLTEINSNAAGGDFWELTNVGKMTQDIGGWKWDDDSANPLDAAAVTIPAGTMIAPGESIIFAVVASDAAFRSVWGPLPGVQIIIGGPGLGGGDAVNLFDASGTNVLSFSYNTGGFTQSNGSPAAGGHAGLSAGGTATQSAVIDPSFGIGAGRRYMAATVGVNGAYANTSGGTNIGSPGVTGLSFGGGPSIDLTLNAVPTTFSESAANPASVGTVTRSGATTGALEVTLSSSDTTEAVVPATVTIPDGQTSVNFDITAVDDTFPDGTKMVTISATATGANPDTFDLSITDDGDVLDTDFFLTEIQSNQSGGAPVDAEDYWELTNIGSTTRDISGYSWHDSGRSGATAQAWKLPAGTMIAPGESVIFTAAPAASFRAWWNLPPTVQVFEAAAAPGLGQNDGISFFDPQQDELFFFSYGAGGFTKEDGNPSTGTHAGPSAGGSADSQALVWVPASGTVSPRYTAATGSNYGTFSAVAPATDFGSPGIANVKTVSLSDNSATEGNIGTSILALTVTRSDTATAFTVDYAVTGGTATSGTDFATLANGTLTFTDGGAATQTIHLTINGDTDPESDETVVVTLSNIVNTTGDTIIGTASGTGTILNDDVIAPSLTLSVGGSTIASGGVTTLRVAATGNPAPTLQWYQGNKGDTSNPISGATSPTLLTPALTGSTNFWVRASNAGGDFDGDTITVDVVAPVTSVDLSNYVRVGRYSLPEPLLTALPAGTPAHNLLCQEASGVTYNWDTDTLFVVADGGRSVTQVSKTGVLIDTMTLALGSSPQGTEFYDIEGVTYIGGGQFVMAEERDRQLVKFTYAAGTTLTRAQTQTVKIGTFVDNTGTEGLSYDPLTSGFVVLKEISPIGIFQTTVDFGAGTASNGSASTVNSTDLFNPALLGMTDVADVFALSVLPSMAGQAQQANLIVLSQEDGKMVNIDRTGVISSTRQILSDPGNPLSVAGQQHEGVTMDAAGFIYVVNENGGGSIDFPELWVFAPSTVPNAAPTGLSVNGAVTSVIENSSTASPIRLGEIVVVDDGLGTNVLSLADTDASFFELVGNTLFLKAGTILDFETKSSYQITLQVDDATLGTTPDATEPFTLTVTDQDPETPPPPALLITEVAPWSSGDSAVAADWFEVTNISPNAVDISGWKVDDSSKAFGSAVALNGITSIAPGESVIFIETSDLPGKTAAFVSNWFGAMAPSGLRIGSYSGSGIGLSTGGDAVWLFDPIGQIRAGVTFGAAPGGPFATFDNTAGLNNTAISKLSIVGVNGALQADAADDEIGSPGYAAPGLLRITEVAPWSSGNSPVGADWFEVTNVGARVVSLEGWKIDDSSESPLGGAVPLNGIAAIAPGESVIFLETETVAPTTAAFLSNWFGASPPSGLQIGTYNGSGVGLSTGGDAVNLFDAANVRQAKVTFGASPSSAPYGTFDNSAVADNAAITLQSAGGVNGAFVAANSAVEIGSPGLLVVTITPSITGGTGGTVTGGGSLPVGGSVAFTAVPDMGYEFRRWIVNGVPSPETSTTLNLVVTAGLTVEAEFARTNFTLQLLHFADAEAGLLASQTAPNLAALVDAFDDDYANTIILAGGDNYIPGPFAAAGTDAVVAATHNKGNNPFAADIEIHNRIGVQASTIGNHEFDFGTNAFSDAVNDTAFPYLSANLDFSGDSGISARYQETVGVGGLEEASTLAKKIVPSAVITVNGEMIGLVGATTQIIETISSTGGVEVKGFTGDGSETNDMTLLASQLQPVIDDLTGQGVNKIVLMAHLQQIALEQSLAPLLTGVDIVLAAGSNTRLGDADDVAVPFTGHAADFANTYPIVTAGADTKPVLIVNTDNEFTYLGRLVVNFDGNGEIDLAGLPDRVPENGAYAATAANVAAAWGVAEGDLPTTAFAVGTKGAGVKQITDAVQSVIAAKDGDVKGYTNHYLEGERNFVRNQETNLGNLSADANAFVLAQAAGDTIPIVSLKNGGGIRAAIGAVDVVSGAKNPPLANPGAGKPAGGVSVLDIENSMRFNNRLLAFETTPAGLKAILEHGVAVLGNQGRFPQIGGVAFAYDPTRTAGDRITKISLIGEEGQLHEALYDGAFSPWAPPVIRLVTLNFLANGGDGYPMKANGTNFRYLLDDGTLGPILDPTLDFTTSPSLPANALGEQKALADFLTGRHATPATAYDVADTAPADDLRIQNLSSRNDAVPFDLTLILGGDGTGSAGGQSIEGGERQGYRFTLTQTRRVEITGTGASGLKAELLDSSGNVVGEFTGTGGILLAANLAAGDYLLRILNEGTTSATIDLDVDASQTPMSRPDAAIGKTLQSLTGVGAYGPPSTQELFARVRNLAPVKAIVAIANQGNVDDRLQVRGTRGNRDFDVTYRQGTRNITASLTLGRFQTGSLGMEDAPVFIQSTITPNKRTLIRTITPPRRPNGAPVDRFGAEGGNGGRKPKKVVLGRDFSAQITATSTGNPSQSDTVQFRVSTR